MDNTFTTEFNKLNEDQKQVVNSLDGPVMVVAGPGTGKTQVLALRIVNILDKTDTNPENILCITFTEAGVAAMRKRLVKFIGNNAYKIGIFTFHGFCNSVIENNPEYFAFKKELKNISQIQKYQIISEIIDEKILENTNFKLRENINRYGKVKAIIDTISKTKLERLTTSEIESRIQSIQTELENTIANSKKQKATKVIEKKLLKLEIMREFVSVFERYNEMLTELGLYDFEDMINFVITALKNNPDLLSNYWETYQYIHVDEYQDSNSSQNALVQLLTSYDSSPNIFAVGDDDQAIFRFQGANIANILDFKSSYKNVNVVPIRTNYRSTQSILNNAMSVIQNNSQRLVNIDSTLDKTLVSGVRNPIEIPVDVREFSTKEKEDIFVAKEIKRLIDSQVRPNEITVIVRAKSKADGLISILNKIGVPLNSWSSNNVFSNPIVKNLINIIEVLKLYNKEISINLYNTLLNPLFQIPVEYIYKVNIFAHNNKISLEQIILNKNIEFIQDSEILEILEYIENKFTKYIFKWHALSINRSIDDLLDSILADLEVFDFIKSFEEASFEDLSAIYSLKKYIKEFCESTTENNIDHFWDSLSISKDFNISLEIKTPPNVDGINITTAHSSKGLEFEHVFIIGCTENNWGKTRNSTLLLSPEIFDSEYSKEENETDDLEEIRRLFFVAMTRAKNQLYISYYGQEDSDSKKLEPSIFIDELSKSDIRSYSSEELENNISTQQAIIDLNILAAPQKSESYSIGEKLFLQNLVEHISISPSNLESYLRSPLEYKESILLKKPTLKTNSSELGTAIHYALDRIFEYFKINKAVPSIEMVKNWYVEKLFATFGGFEEYETTKEDGLSILQEYYQQNSAVSDWQNMIFGEYNFSNKKIFLNFSDGLNIKLSGRIDRIQKQETDSLEVQLIDYKVKDPVSDNSILGGTQDKNNTKMYRQLTFYVLLCKLDNSFKPNINSSTKYIPTTASIQFLRKTSKQFKTASFPISDSDIENLKNLIQVVVSKIRNLEFPEEPNIKFKSALEFEVLE